MAVAELVTRKPLPFDAGQLDKLLDDAGIDVLVATSKHNVQYLLGGYRFFFFDTMDAVGVSRYLPALVYRKGKPEQAAYIGCAMENFEKELGKFWPPALELGDTGSQATMQQALAHIKKLGSGVRRVGVETAFLPADAEAVLRQGLSNVDIVDAVVPLERLRARKTPEEIAYLREASERVVASMLATFKQCKPGVTKDEMVETLRREEVNRGLVFDYCLITAGTSLNRAPSEQRLAGRRHHVARLRRQLQGLHRRSLPHGHPRQARRRAGGPAGLRRGGAAGGAQAHPHRRARRRHHRRRRARWWPDVAARKYTHYMAHGMGLVSHEAPRLMNIPRMSYTAYDTDRPLESGMVISIETTMAHPKRGFIKLEDTVVVTDDGYGRLRRRGARLEHGRVASKRPSLRRPAPRPH